MFLNKNIGIYKTGFPKLGFITILCLEFRFQVNLHTMQHSHTGLEKLRF